MKRIMKTDRIHVTLGLLLVLWIFSGIMNEINGMTSNEAVKMIPLYIGNHKFTVELADTPEKRALGFMFRENIPSDFGMLFISDMEEYQSFWMKNCKSNLDIIYLDSRKQVVDIYFNVPPCPYEPCPTYESRKPAQYVLELRGKRAKEINLKIGDSIFFMLKK